MGESVGTGEGEDVGESISSMRGGGNHGKSPLAPVAETHGRVHCPSGGEPMGELLDS